MVRTKSGLNVEVAKFNEKYRDDFERLNREWIDAFFTLEDADRAIFADPEGKVVSPGGQIFFVLQDGEAIGTCALLKQDRDTFELAKMAVAASARGKGYGDLLMKAAIDFARGAGAKAIILSSNTRLSPAIRLYEKHGFHSIPLVADERYHRVDLMMRLDLTQK